MGEGALSSYASGNSHKKKKTCLCCFKIPSQYKIQKTDLAILEALDLEQLDTLNKPYHQKLKHHWNFASEKSVKFRPELWIILFNVVKRY